MSELEIIDYREAGEARRYRETFDEGYFDIDAHGNVDIVLRRVSSAQGDPTQTTTQIVHIRTVWRSIPGRTVAHRTQLNGMISYHILSGGIAATFEGAGSVFFRIARGRDLLSGTLDLAVLHPKRQLTAGGSLFKRAELTGEFRATRDIRRVARIVNEMNRLFGPLPSASTLQSKRTQRRP